LLGKRLGRSVAKKPETLTLEEVLEEAPDEDEPADTEPTPDSMGVIVDPTVEAEHRTKYQQEQAWTKFRANRGWTDAAQTRVLTDFIRAKGLFPELTAFAAKQSRR
jgi:hypothetical protein